MANSNIYQDDEIPSITRQLFTIYSRSGINMLAFWFLLTMIVLALVGHWISPYHYLDQDINLLLLPPSWMENGRVDYFFGTDDLGRDLLSRVMSGAHYTLGGAFLTVVLSGIIGISIGAIAAMLRGIRSSVLHHLLDTILAIPSLMMAILVIAVFGKGWETILLAVTIGLIPQFIRVSHQATLSVLSQEYVRMARLDGYSGVNLFSKVLLPNIAEPLIARFTTALSSAIMDIAALGFLNLGAQAPSPEWGTMMANGIELLTRAPWVIALPGVVLFLTVLCVNVAGEGLTASFKQLRIS